MSELYNRYDRGAVSDRITQPPFADLTARARRRVHRILAVRLSGVAVFAALVAVPLVTIWGDGGRTPPTQVPDIVILPAWQDDVQFPPELEDGGWVGGGPVFYDTSYGIYTYAAGDCDKWISVTRDGGKNWSELRELPSASQETSDCSFSRMIPIAEDTLVITTGPPGSPFISHDSGRTWQEYEPEVRTANVLPDGVVAGGYCELLLPAPCGTDRVRWLDPQTGDLMVLRNNPPAGVGYGLVMAPDGSVWATGIDPSGNVHVAVSRDRGRSWLDGSLGRTEDAGTPVVGEGPTGVPLYVQLAAADGSTGYLAWTEDLGSPAVLYRTTDGGATWQPLPAGQPFAGVLNMWVNRRGDLVVDEEAVEAYVGSDGEYISDMTQHLSSDGGETFDNLDRPVWNVQPLPGGYLGALGEGVEAISEDGLTWQPFRIPRP